MRNVLARAAVGLALFVTSYAHAWCQTNTCDRQDAPAANCLTPVNNECLSQGKPVAWPTTCVSTSVSAQGSPKQGITAEQMRQIVHDAFNQWSSADCGDGRTPSIVVDTFPDVNCTDVLGDAGYKPNGPNYNIWIFRDDDWPLDAFAEQAIAITTTRYSVETGMIYDADVEVNSYGQTFTTGLDTVDMDLPSVVQHEAGHFLGLGHSNLPEATMYSSIDPADLSRRTLAPDDIKGICSVYQPGHLDPNCDPEPRHGFSTECAFDKGCCTIAPGRSSQRRGFPGTLLLGALVLLAALRTKSTDTEGKVP